ncbi:phosphatase PAP2 family protein [Blastococcus sp. TF02A-26]|uniref:phosphatase PAP2 family protein n=1 Tax=Blastococcus sp. TF02A-26 TaxID=2250577 RepID=UPI0013145761|nr:phosphatase PAP2 family protein [Blastococcus sp. TF02A-26]
MTGSAGTPRHRRRAADGAVAAAAALVAVLCSLAVASGEVGPAEAAVFRVVNGWPDALQGPLWLLQLLGVLGMPLLLAVPALAVGRLRLALALVALVPLKLLVHGELVKALVQRSRPGSTIEDAVLRDVPSAGIAYPSGHAVVAFGVVVLLWPYLRGRWRAAVLALAVLNSVARVYLGAHAPLDVVGGAAVGVCLGAVLCLAVGVPARQACSTAAPPKRPAARSARARGASSIE